MHNAPDLLGLGARVRIPSKSHSTPFSFCVFRRAKHRGASEKVPVVAVVAISLLLLVLLCRAERQGPRSLPCETNAAVRFARKGRENDRVSGCGGPPIPGNAHPLFFSRTGRETCDPRVRGPSDFASSSSPFPFFSFLFSKRREGRKEEGRNRMRRPAPRRS